MYSSTDLFHNKSVNTWLQPPQDMIEIEDLFMWLSLAGKIDRSDMSNCELRLRQLYRQSCKEYR